MRYVTGVRAAPLVKYLISSRPRRHFEIFFRLQRRHTTFFRLLLKLNVEKIVLATRWELVFRKHFPETAMVVQTETQLVLVIRCTRWTRRFTWKCWNFGRFPRRTLMSPGSRSLAKDYWQVFMTEIVLFSSLMTTFEGFFTFWTLLFPLENWISSFWNWRLQRTLIRPPGLDLVTYSKNLRLIEFLKILFM